MGDILAGLKKATGLGKQLKQAQIWEQWARLAGEHLSKHGRPQRIRDKTLFVEADSPVWMHKYSYRKWDIIKRVNRLAGGELISDIFIVLPEDDEDAPPQDGV